MPSDSEGHLARQMLREPVHKLLPRRLPVNRFAIPFEIALVQILFVFLGHLALAYLDVFLEPSSYMLSVLN